MKSRNLIKLTILAATVALYSCVRNNIDTTKDPTISGIVVPTDFDWSTLASTQVTVIPADAYSGEYYYVVEIFGVNPVLNSSAILLSKGVANSKQNYVADLILPSATHVVYVRQTDPLNNQIVQSVALGSGSSVCDFNTSSTAKASVASKMPAMMSSVMKKSEGVAPDPTPTGATELTAKTADVSWSTNKNYVIPAGVTYAGQIVLGSNSSIYVEGSYKPSGNKTLTMATGSKFIIQTGGTAVFSSSKDLQFDNNAIIKNFGSLSAASTFKITGTTKLYNAGTMDFVKFNATNTCEIQNFGTFTSNNSVSLNSGAILTNYDKGKINFAEFSTSNNTNIVQNSGEFNAKDVTVKSVPFNNTGSGSLTVEKTLKLTSPCTFNNSGAVVANDLTTESGTKIYNNCHMLVEDATSVPGTSIYLYGGSLLKTKTLLGDGTSFEMDKGAILEAETASFTTWRNYIKSVGTDYALARLQTVEPKDKKNLSSNITYQGKVEVECETHTQNPQYNTFYVVQGSDVRWASTGKSSTSIKSTDCNSGGNVVETNPGGGAEVPEDPKFPIEVVLSTDYTFIMEDNWPLLGDYDMNDLVVDLGISYLQNADNKAIEMKVAYKLRAVGAGKRIAAAFQLNKLLPTAVSSISYKYPVLTGGVFSTEKGGLEKGQSKAVIPLFDDAHSLLDRTSGGTALLNTIIGNAYFAPVSDTLTIVFDTPIDPADISIANLNFFIVTDGNVTSEKRTEIHLSGFEPTDKMDVSLFGTADDASVGSNKYRTSKNLVWGLLIPKSFNYSAEYIDVTASYPQFAGWCTSGGSENDLWYETPTDKSGYIYTVK